MMNTGTRETNGPCHVSEEGRHVDTIFCRESVLTIKFGALPIYVLAPINTAPQEIAERSFTEPRFPALRIPLVNPRVPAVVRNTR